jgi:signal transduction histidine kinase/CheY-like chemotaxis protein
MSKLKNPLQSALIAMAVALLALAAQWAIVPLAGNRLPFVFFVVAVGYVGAFLGWWPALLVLILGSVNAAVQLQGYGMPVGARAGDLATLGVFFAASLILAAGGGLLRKRMHMLSSQSKADRHDRLQESEARMRTVMQSRTVLDQSPLPFCLWSPQRDRQGQVVDYTWTYANPATFLELNLPFTARTGEPVSSALSDLWDAEGLRDGLERVLEKRELHRFEVLNQRDGRWFKLVSWPHDTDVALWISDVTEEKRQEELRRDSERKKDQFIATLAHELRNPLAPIKQAAALLENQAIPDERKRWAADVIQRQVAVMSWLLEDLLDMSRIALGKLVLRKTDVELDQVVETAVQTVKPVISSKGHTLSVRVLTPGVWLHADPVRISQIIGNLLTNAAKYTPHGGHIDLSVESKARGLDICVTDSGIGIESQNLEEIFNLYRQVNGEHSRSHDGLGMGLAIVKGLVELHGGRVHAHSPGLGQGALFTVHLPADLRIAAPADASSMRQPAQASVKRVLVADDNHDAADTLTLLLRAMGHTVDVVYDGLQAVECFSNVQPDVAILDIGMPGMDGYQAARAIRALPKGDNAKLIALSGWGQPMDRKNSEEAGFDKHFTKPVDIAQLSSQLR